MWCAQVIEAGSAATYDWNRLTRLVLPAHRDAVRIEIASSGPRLVKIIAHKREAPKDGDSIWMRHPTLSDLIKEIEEMMPIEEGGQW